MKINVCNFVLHVFKSKESDSNDIIRIIQKTQVHQDKVITVLQRVKQSNVTSHQFLHIIQT